ncbi:MAG: PAS domain-containing methyl-accepting chemotaxis protein [Alphaproteobacteria bacterium]|jgi:methyl-accepting chemotaxis protein|uniref:methyl-accepting chemotaxis protein n=1 Tax=Rhizobium/Agrobacterium group TaxID=227290 RepID=UPI0006B8E5BF|nr:MULTISPECIES: PAS domain-containing methyl-accepting chemotaxis protein [Rhizobium/Agrobacterium group]MBU0740391.1 PAS domain-containing methyl-accepting chemotaxis protein [Alphaproteobacteria bacterium]MDM7978853.1 PAS domain-containing methyl-accepting chemotaxis protein [Rhizobium sp.]AOG10548.1 sensory box protein [Agrobacterium sp. RAC06]KPF59799.1 chemotaxis protein [Rhizobium sp. AAP116]MBU0835300.1 PAS domain-containing methyl-accepting chemotaxis protein [Alphaproteobacteria bact
MSLLPFFGNESRSILNALDRSQAVIEFDLTGTILSANRNFCLTVGYELAEIVGKHHSMFVGQDYANSPEYKTFWSRLSRGEFFSAQYKRFGKGGREIWIEASYNPIMRGGKPYKVVKFATDITERKRAELENSGKLNAISRAQATIEFTPDGQILTANPNFLSAIGYKLEEIMGKHHAIFCEGEYARSPEYHAFWKDLRAGEFKSSEFTRIRKDGSKLYIQASYNPIFDEDGRVFKVVKFAIDVTGRVQAVDAIAAGLARLSECNIRITIDDPFIPEFERLRNDFNKAIEEFQKTLESVLGETGSLTENSESLKGDAESLGRRTEQQAAALEQASAALEQITATVKEASVRARDTREIVKEARAATGQSVEVVRSTVEAIGRIENASKEIGSIIDVIDQIAFQTNLLALNAGVEAARAGDAGKGFAVVAQEVRELAQRSAAAAREISALILNSTNEVSEGVRLVNATGASLERIEKFVNEINTNVDAIATGANEQASSLSEINNAVNQLDQATQQNAGLVSSITAASDIMALGAGKMKTLVDIFKLNRRSARREPGSAAAATGSHLRGRQSAAA